MGSSRLTRGLLATVAAVGAFVIAAPAQAAPSCTTTTPALDQQITCSYSAGGSTDITVPTGAAYVTVTLNGAGGGGGGGGNTLSAEGGPGGQGARVVGQFDLDGLGSLRVVLGAGGTGALAGPDPGEGGAGGGYSAVYRGASSAASDVLAVAGGGGGGQGGFSLAATSTMAGGDGAASNTSAGGDSTGTDPGGGADGSGSGGTSNITAGSSWAAGGSGGSGGDSDAGDGGSGYGGGGEGGPLYGGGGAGGSYADGTYLVGSATYSPAGGAGGAGGTGSSNGTDGVDGSITLTFTAAPVAPTTTVDQTPAPILLQVGLLPGEECAPGWDPSWADWAIPTTGGPVCTMTVVYRGNRWVNALHPQVAFVSPWE